MADPHPVRPLVDAAEPGALQELGELVAVVAPEVADAFVHAAVEPLVGRNAHDEAAVGGDKLTPPLEGGEVVFDVFEDLEGADDVELSGGVWVGRLRDAAAEQGLGSVERLRIGFDAPVVVLAGEHGAHCPAATSDLEHGARAGGDQAPHDRVSEPAAYGQHARTVVGKRAWRAPRASSPTRPTARSHPW